ncbi:MAG: outer membrane protein assembly factor BamA [Rhodospirillaceae bacterium]|nr:outer membrane protein assembly factor BamA [Rhodospirillaceae bacterium]
MHKLALIFAVIIFSIAGSVLPATAQSSDQLVEVEEIVIDGNRRVAASTILSYLPVRVGDRVTQSALSIALQRLFETQLFKDIDVFLDGGILNVTVLENPIINRVNIEGNDVLKDERLLEVLDIQPRRVYTRELALEGSQRLLEVYQASGRYAAVVEPQIIELSDNRVDLAFMVSEGPLIKINSISFSGNRRFSDRVLTRSISSSESKWWAIFASSDKYDESRLDYDVRLLRQFYLSRGYADIEVSRVKGGLLPDRTGFAVTFLLNEGVRYRVDEIEITSEIENVDLEAMQSVFDFGGDQWYDVRALEQGLLDITNQLGALGYAFVNIDTEIQTDPESETLDVALRIGKAQKNFIERVEIVNNARTLDTVVRREMELVEGDPYNQLKLDRSIRNIRNLGFFSDVSVRNYVGSSDDQTITEIAVEEQSTGELSIGLGYSSIDKSSILFGIDERNFLGTGRAVSLSLDLAKTRTNISLGITEPYLFGRNLTGRATLFNDKTKLNKTTATRTGFDLGIGFSAANDYYHNVSYELSQAKTTSTATNATSVTGENGKSILTSAVGYTLSRDKRDNRFDPTEGTLFRIFQQLGGLGGDAKYYKATIDGAYYKPFNFNTFVFGAKARYGTVVGLSGEKVTQSNRFFLGGNSVRGFDGSGIGPRDTGSNAAVGGNNVMTAGVEVISNLGLSKDLGMRWTVFSDVGSVWDTDFPTGVTGANDNSLRSSLGVGILWDTFIGPMSFYWANATSKKSYDQTSTFQFAIGTRL